MDVSTMARQKPYWVLDKKTIKESKPDFYGVFVWTEKNRYPKANAVKLYKRERAAQTFCDKNFGKGYVVRPIL